MIWRKGFQDNEPDQLSFRVNRKDQFSHSKTNIYKTIHKHIDKTIDTHIDATTSIFTNI